MRLLDQVNDIEVVWLHFHREIQTDEAGNFRQKHKDVLTPVIASINSSMDIVNKQALQESYKEHLSQIGLLEPNYHINMQTNLPDFDRTSGAMKVWYYGITTLGNVLLNQIGLGEQEETD